MELAAVLPIPSLVLAPAVQPSAVAAGCTSIPGGE
jgi:hypothetical protein